MKQVTFEIQLHCDINDYGTIIPTGLNYGAKDKKGKDVNLNNFPPVEELLIVWLGQYYSYPKLKK